MTSVLLVIFLSQARIFLAMARDGLLPHSIFGVVHERFRTPHRSTMLTGVLIALAAGFLPVRLLEEMVNIGTLLAFELVCASVLVLRITRPNAERPFRCPGLFVVAPLGILVNLSMMLFLPLDTWIRLAVWLAVGLVIYFIYGLHHSTLGNNLERRDEAPRSHRKRRPAFLERELFVAWDKRAKRAQAHRLCFPCAPRWWAGVASRACPTLQSREWKRSAESPRIWSSISRPSPMASSSAGCDIRERICPPAVAVALSCRNAGGKRKGHPSYHLHAPRGAGHRQGGFRLPAVRPGGPRSAPLSAARDHQAVLARLAALWPARPGDL